MCEIHQNVPIVQGMNGILKEQTCQHSNSTVMFSWIVFSDFEDIEVKMLDVPIQSVPRLLESVQTLQVQPFRRDQIQAYGSTALLSAIKAAYLLDHQHEDAKTLIFVITDGEENSSNVTAQEVRYESLMLTMLT